MLILKPADIGEERNSFPAFGAKSEINFIGFPGQTEHGKQVGLVEDASGDGEESVDVDLLQFLSGVTDIRAERWVTSQDSAVILEEEDTARDPIEQVIPGELSGEKL